NVTDFCDRAILIHDSRIVEEGDPQKVATAYLKLNNPEENVEKKAKRDAELTKRWGNKKAQILNIKVDRVKHDHVTVTARYRINQQIEQPIIGFHINDPRGNKIVESNTLWNGIKTGVFESGQIISVEWKVDNIFTNGEHKITAAIADQSGIEFYDWWEDALSFIVNRSIVTSALTLPKQDIIIAAESPVKDN
ncbi:MAG: Wzt carbohydrate-binding domain-containing protein, partial [Bdellovibrionaceae bacterium]|nr:Wzt carbohydrate-binding domain-containing protein [Pseudobdellovibrionaceae bacterium]